MSGCRLTIEAVVYLAGWALAIVLAVVWAMYQRHLDNLESQTRTKHESHTKPVPREEDRDGDKS